jgi:N-carbamoylputrescine amidase
MGSSSPQPVKERENKTGLLVAVQTKAVTGQVAENLAAMEDVLAGLPNAEERLVVFPEMGTSGYFFGERERLWGLSESVPEGLVSQQLIAMAAKYNCYLVAGLPERQGKTLYNCAVLVGPQGYIAKYRKLHLWDQEKLLYEPGDLGLVLAETPLGRIGLIICYDLWFPEQARILRLMGADVIAMPAALVWNDTPAHVRRGYYMADYVAMVTAHLNQVYLAMASQVGRDEEHWLFGSSVIVSPYGWPLVEPASDDESAVLHAQVDFTLGRKLRGWSSMDNFDRDRRTDVYGKLLGYMEDQGETS